MDMRFQNHVTLMGRVAKAPVTVGEGSREITLFDLVTRRYYESKIWTVLFCDLGDIFSRTTKWKKQTTVLYCSTFSVTWVLPCDWANWYGKLAMRDFIDVPQQMRMETLSMIPIFTLSSCRTKPRVFITMSRTRFGKEIAFTSKVCASMLHLHDGF